MKVGPRLRGRSLHDIVVDGLDDLQRTVNDARKDSFSSLKDHRKGFGLF